MQRLVGKKEGADMLRRFGMLYMLSGVGLLLRRLRMEDRSADNIRRASEKGPLVYVLYARSKLDWLALNRSLNNRRLPLATFTWGMRSFWFRPIFDAVSQLWLAIKQGFSKQYSDSAHLMTALKSNRPVAVFLIRPTPRGGEPTGVIHQLAELQKSLEKPIQLTPICVVWNRRPEKLRSDTLRFLLGAADEPGPLQKLLYVINRDHEPVIQAGVPVDLPSLLNRYESRPIERQVRAVRLLLRRYLYRESHAIRGPRIRPHRWMKRLVMDSSEIRNLIAVQSKESRRKPAEVRVKVEKTLDHIAARFSFSMVKVIATICRLIWSRIYSGVDIREEDLERLRSAIRSGSPILAPSHRSHLDYLLISSLCYERGLVLPHIVAGENLSFWPMGAIFRRCGAFFIKRSFKGDPIFPTVFARYMGQLIRDEFPIEFFIEGGRSRSGKLLPPKLGVMGIVMEAAAHVRPDRDVPILPIAVSYEQIAEEKAYARELSGQKKKKESVQGVLKASKVLSKRFGKVYIRVGEPISLRDYMQSLEKPWGELGSERRKEALHDIGEQIMHAIGKNMVILPTGITAMALLCSTAKGQRLVSIQERAKRFDVLLRMQGAARANSLTHGGWVVMEALDRFVKEKWIQKISDEKGEIIQIHSDYRVTLEYYKNGLIHYIAPHAMLATAILSTGKCHGDETLRLFLTQIFLLRYEFPTDPNSSMEELARRCRIEMAEYGALHCDENNVYSIASQPLLEELGGLVLNFLESYLLVLKAAEALQSKSFTEKELPAKIQAFGQKRVAIDQITRPESLSVLNLKNALRAYKEEGVIQLRMDGSGLKFDALAQSEYVSDLTRLLDVQAI